MGDYNEYFTDGSEAAIVPVIETMPADLLTPLAVYLKLADDETNSFLLESVEGGETLARYSFIGAAPDFNFGGSDETVRICDKGGETTLDIPLMDFLRNLLSKPVLADDELPLFSGGAIGYFDFSCARWFEPTLKSLQSKADSADEARFMFFTSVIAFDHAKQVIKIITLVERSHGGDDKRFRQRFEAARTKNRRIRHRLETEPIAVPAMHGTQSAASTHPNWTRAQFESAVDEIKALIAAGECYQVVLSQCFSRKTSASPVAIYRALRSLNPSPYMFLMNFMDKAIIGASPEMLVRCRRQNLEYRPIAGTRPRGKTPEEDTRLAEEMRHDKKEVAEHLMLVDLGRNDLGRVSEFGSIEVTSLMQVERYSHVQHLVSSITSRLREGMDRFDALAACFPAGTVSGAPKVRAIEIISALEPTPRGVYAGAVGYFDYTGNMDTCIAIRTLVVENGTAKVQAGAGIVADSVPENEFDETVNKASALLRTIEIAEGNGF